jgi:hypothetical protein
MLSDIFWTIATSKPALWFDGLLLLAGLFFGYAPLKYVPVIGPRVVPYIEAARLVAPPGRADDCVSVGLPGRP